MVTGALLDRINELHREESVLMASRHRSLLAALQEFTEELDTAAVASNGDQLKTCQQGQAGTPNTLSAAKTDETTDFSVRKELEDQQSPRQSYSSAKEEPPGEARQISKIFSSRRARLAVIQPSDDDSRPWWHPGRVIRSPKFEIFFSVLILLSAVFMAAELQYSGLDNGYVIGYKKFDRPAPDEWPAAPDMFVVMDVLFGIFFTLEVILKMLGQQWMWAFSAWNWLDGCLVVLWIAESSTRYLPVDGSLLRLIRLARLLRLLRLARAMQGFDSLVVMTTALRGSVSALFWVAVLLVIVQMAFALLLGQTLMPFVRDEGQAIEERQKIFEYFGTFARALLTMFELTLGNWVPVARMLQDLSSFLVIFSLVHKVTFGFACIGVINGVFMQETFKVAQSDDEIVMRTAQNRHNAHVKKMMEFMYEADRTGDGKISKDEWLKVLENKFVYHWFAGQGLNLKNADRMFTLLESDGDGKLSVEELVEGVLRLQGAAKSCDVVEILEEQRAMQRTFQTMLEDIDRRLTSAEMQKQVNPDVKFEIEAPPPVAFEETSKPAPEPPVRDISREPQVSPLNVSTEFRKLHL
eukprot:TRINITY_DN21230_c0_g1_i3.p1 TRINITY_DN21230_c0_g1~~TRINITY_DN21230_c0_g1_i3.p1  ORF type:complete len:581 (-),score=113.08 TRINITY_DN21230_c0_g1_i3:13-1755(-)